jgi:TonB family protein
MKTSMKRFNIIYKRPNITPDEAKVVADFDQLLIKHQGRNDPSSNLWPISGGIAVFIILIGALFIITNRPPIDSENPDPGSSTESVPVVEDTQTLDQTPVVAETQDDLEDEPIESEKTLPKSATELDTQELLVPANNSGFNEASPVDGFPALYQYFDERLIYPAQILDEGVEGNVIVKFVIDINGLPTKIVIEKSLHEKLDSAAITLIQQMPRWYPASLDGQAIPSTHHIPFFFQIDQAVE